MQPKKPSQLEDLLYKLGAVACAQNLERSVGWHLMWKPAEKVAWGEIGLYYLVASPEVSTNAGPRN